MKAAQAIEEGRFEIIDIPQPDPTSGKVLVRLERFGICGSDLELITRERTSSEFPLPVGFSGHECIGVVEAAPDVSEYAEGDRVLIVPPAADGFREWYLAEPEWLVKQPNHVDPELLVVGQPLGTAIHGLKKFDRVVGLDTVVLGQGGVGLLLAALLNRAGAKSVIAVDLYNENLNVSKQMGATHLVNASDQDPIEAVAEITEGRLADIVIEAVGAEQTIRQAPYIVKKFGTIMAFGVPKEETVTFEYEKFLRKQLRMIASDRTGDEPGYSSFRLAAQWLGEGRIDVSPLITHRLPFEQLQQAFEMQLNRSDGVIKAILEI